MSSFTGRVLTLVARARVPIFGAERYAAGRPGDDPPPEGSAYVERCDPGAAQPGPLDGDVIVKDQIDVAGTRTGIGLADRGPIMDSDAAVVARVRAAGGRITGKAVMTELGIDGLGTLIHGVIPLNPRSAGYCPGGSSTGTAVALSSGQVRYGIGGDGLGSIRIPSAFNGLVGLKAGRTALPREGIRSPVRSIDAIGPMARTASDCAALWQAMAGEPVTPLEPFVPPAVALPASRMRVARSVYRAFVRMLQALGTETRIATLAGIESVTFLGGMIGAHESATGPMSGRGTTPAGHRSLKLGKSIGALDFARLVDQRDRLRERTLRLLDQTPIIASPTTSFPAPALTPALIAGQSAIPMLRGLGAFTPHANLCDLPSIAVPSGVDDRGRPLSIMFTGAPGSETTLLRIALAVERTGLGESPV